MTDHKFTDEMYWCKEGFAVCRVAYDFINRQKREIERLENQIVEKSEEIDRISYALADEVKLKAEIKTEAIKEFAEKLKPRLDCEYGNKFYRDKCFDEIDTLVKEMTGEIKP